MNAFGSPISNELPCNGEDSSITNELPCDVEAILRIFSKYLKDDLMKIEFKNLSTQVRKEVIVMVTVKKKMSFNEFCDNNYDFYCELVEYLGTIDMFISFIMGSKITCKFYTKEEIDNL
jgi:hypothetical protein